MKRTQKIALLLSLAAAGTIIYVFSARSGTRRKLTQIAEEGYETAQDVLFPGRVIKDKRLHYGPVIPD